MSLYRLIYSSTASLELTPTDLKEILDVSEKHNSENGITGLLCYGNQTFLQILEGEWEEVNKTYHRIAQDTRHHTPRLIECLPITVRSFEVWSMQAITLTELSTEQIKTLILKHSGTVKLRPELMRPDQCLNFLLDVAKIYQLSDNFYLDL